MCFTHSFFHFILFENLFKPRQRRLAVCMVTDFSVLSATSKQCLELTSSVLSTTSKHCVSSIYNLKAVL
ncbi:S1 RNA-binding domain-containing protein [Streptococcus pneumoniae]|nr:S1 RNA-binding domain-containing protein [Streptococcus pneumoniae]